MLFLEDGSVLKSTLLGALECKLARPTVYYTFKTCPLSPF